MGSTSDGEFIQLDKHMFLIAEQPRIAALIRFRCDKYAARAHLVPATLIIDCDLVRERLML